MQNQDNAGARKPLGFVEIFCLASGAMISSGLFVLPAIIFAEAGPSVLIAYILAGIMMIPSLLAKAELATAMPKSGGSYFFVERSLGPLLGSFAGFAGWFSVALKGAFALVGIGTFWSYIDPSAGALTFKIVALCFVLIFTIINLFGLRSSAKSQIIMVALLLSVLAVYIIFGATKGRPLSPTEFLPDGNFAKIFTLAGTVFVSFGGLTKVVAVAHEVRNPGKTIPKGMIYSFVVVIAIYILAIGVTISLLDPATFTNTFTPLSEGAAVIAGRAGAIALSAAALLAFATTANATILAAAQNPLAMARDGLIPAWLGRSNSRGVPVAAILLTSGFMALVIIVLDISSLVKAASTMMLILFLLVNLSLILMRESRIVSYRPLYTLPLYPLLPIAGILLSAFLVYAMGTLPLIISSGFFAFSTLWTIVYKKKRPKRDSALLRIVERIAAREIRGASLSEELGEILRDRDSVSEDNFDKLIRKAIVLDLNQQTSRDALFKKIAGAFTLRFETSYEEILMKLRQREEESTTVVSDDIAIPHIVLDDAEGFEIVLIRSQEGIAFNENGQKPRIVFALAGARAERNFHLQCLMAIAQISRSADFQERWMAAFDEEELRLLVLLADRKR